MTAARVIRRGDWRTMPWANGGGVTHELWRSPSEGEWQARLSIAEVAQSGPFSLFPGVDRVICCLEGRGFELTGAAGEHRITSDSAPLAFAGDEAWNCTLLEGAVMDFNVMVRRQWGSAKVWPAEGEVRADFILALARGVRVGGATLDRWECLVARGEAYQVAGPALAVSLRPALSPPR